EIKKSSKSVKIRFDDRTATYNYDSLNDIELAYCMTVHKSQGNEFEAVIIPVHTPPTPLIYRNLLYTAVTRAKKLIIFVGKAETVYKMIANYKKKIRYSNFQSFLSEYSDQG
ncbi:MAG: ATP-binding domain-containing protein, partial [Clostridia bacterium]|nr:ATP-binding domain-containing protein [Clostridia bacterium]